MYKRSLPYYFSYLLLILLFWELIYLRPSNANTAFKLAQATTDLQDRFLQPNPLPSPLPPEPDTPVKTTPNDALDSSQLETNKIFVNTIKVTGSTAFTEAEINPIIQPLVEQYVTIEALREASDRITELYLKRGFITSRAIIIEDSLATGTVEIRIIEGQVETIIIEGTKRLNNSYIRSRIKLGVTTPLNSALLEDKLRLLKLDPLLENVEASLKPGSELGQSILVVLVNEANPVTGNFGINNYSPVSVGSEQFEIELAHRNLAGIGDRLQAKYKRTTAGGAHTWEASYRAPVNAMNGTVKIRASFNENEVITPELKPLDIRGDNELYEISYRQPIIRKTREELALSVGFTYRTGQTFTFAGPTPFGFGPDEDGNSRTSVFKLGQEYISRDVSGAWALRSLLNFGTDLFDATVNDAPIPDGLFFSWLAQVQRVQRFSSSNFLIIQADLQLASDGLLPSQQFVIGGGQSLRGYRQNARAGDNGFRFSVEDRITLQKDESGKATFQLAPFLDLGTVWNVDDNPNKLQDQTFLIGAGLGLLWQPIKGFNMRLDYGLPLIELDDKGTNAQDEGFYFSVNYIF